MVSGAPSVMGYEANRPRADRRLGAALIDVHGDAMREAADNDNGGWHL